MKLRHGDEDGIFWIPAPKPERKGAGPRPHVVSGPPPESDWTPPFEFPELHGEVALDVETKDTGLKIMGPGWCFPNAGHIVGVGLAWEGGEGYWPIRHEGGGNLDAAMTMRWLKAQVEKSSVRLICHNALYDFGWLQKEGIRPANKPLDTQVAVSLLDEWRGGGEYNLDACARDYTGIVKDMDLLRRAAAHFGLREKHDLWKLPSCYVGPYGTQDGVATFELWKKVKPMLDAEDLWRVFNLEIDIIQVCIDMRMRGVRVDVDRAVQVSAALKKRINDTQKRIKDLVGFNVDVWAPDSLAKAFDKRGVTYLRSAKKKQPSFKKEWLEACPDELGALVREIRSCEKTDGTFIQGYIIDKNVNGRVHPVFNPLMSDEGGTVSGRMSSSKPNFTNLPARDAEMGPLVRSCILPEEGTKWGAADYSQQEPRWTVHFAALIGAPGAAQAVHQYKTDPTTDFHNYVRDITGLKRFDAKTLNLAMTYGQGEASTCHKLGLPTEWVYSKKWNRNIEVAGPEGKAIINQYHERMPFIRFLSDAVKRRGREVGYVRTHTGRRARGGEGKTRDYAFLNRVIQGSAADQTKIAMVALWKEGILPMVQVHDEIDPPIDSDATAKKVVDIMCNCVPEMVVPSKVDLALGDNWGEAL